MHCKEQGPISRTWSKEGTLIQISDVVEDTSDFDFDAAEYFDMSSTGDWNYEFDVSDSDNITGLRHNLKRQHTKISIHRTISIIFQIEYSFIDFLGCLHMTENGLFVAKTTRNNSRQCDDVQPSTCLYKGLFIQE